MSSVRELHNVLTTTKCQRQHENIQIGSLDCCTQCIFERRLVRNYQPKNLRPGQSAVRLYIGAHEIMINERFGCSRNGEIMAHTCHVFLQFGPAIALLCNPPDLVNRPSQVHIRAVTRIHRQWYLGGRRFCKRRYRQDGGGYCIGGESM